MRTASLSSAARTPNGLKVLRASGAAPLLGGFLWAGEGILGGVVPQTLLFIAPLLFAPGLAGFYFRHRATLKGLGQSGFTQGVVGLGLLAAGFFGAYTLGDPSLLRIASFGFFITAFGLVLTGYACMKEGVLPGFDWLPLALGAVAPLGLLLGDGGAPGLALSVVFGGGWVAFGVLILLDYGRTERGVSSG